MNDDTVNIECSLLSAGIHEKVCKKMKVDYLIERNHKTNTAKVTIHVTDAMQAYYVGKEFAKQYSQL